MGKLLGTCRHMMEQEAEDRLKATKGLPIKRDDNGDFMVE